MNERPPLSPPVLESWREGGQAAKWVSGPGLAKGRRAEKQTDLHAKVNEAKEAKNR